MTAHQGKHIKTIGLLGGMSWESSIEYYRIINQEVNLRLGGVHSARTLMASFDFADIEALQQAGEWDRLTGIMIKAAQNLENAGADCLVICTNTMHRMAAAVQAAIKIPLIHIADATAAAIHARGLQTLGLLGTRFTMEQDFYRARLEQDHGLEVLIPDEVGRELVHNIIYHELVKGIVREDSHQSYLQVIQDLETRGAQGVILGCTEISLLVNQEDVAIPVFDTTLLHALAAVDWALKDIPKKDNTKPKT